MSDDWIIFAVFLGIVAALYFVIAKTIAGKTLLVTSSLMRAKVNSE